MGRELEEVEFDRHVGGVGTSAESFHVACPGSPEVTGVVRRKVGMGYGISTQPSYSGRVSR